MQVVRAECDVRDVFHPQFAARELEGRIMLQTQSYGYVVNGNLQIQLYGDWL